MAVDGLIASGQNLGGGIHEQPNYNSLVPFLDETTF